jgi:Concanavalin A-like lectin/glucanases superfamily
MATAHLFSYNLSANGIITGCTQFGNMAVSLNTTDTPGFSVGNMGNPYHGSDEDLGYVIAYSSLAGTRTHKRRSELAPNAVGFIKSAAKTDASFVDLVNKNFNKSYSSDTTGASSAKDYLTANGYWTSWLPSIVTSGLILNYDISNTSSYPGSGTTITDLQANSNATTFNSPTYTSSGGSYLTFDGIDEYFVTNTSLNSKLSPANTSNIISIFVWTYPMDNGVIVAELGQASANFSWHDSQIEMVAGTIKFSIWTGSVQNLSSSISTPFNNWYYVGFTYDGTNLRGYVNGSLAVTSGTIIRQTPYNNGGGVGLHYAVASEDFTKLGDGSYANMRFGGMQIYNTALSGANVLTNYNAQKSRFGL